MKFIEQYGGYLFAGITAVGIAGAMAGWVGVAVLGGGCWASWAIDRLEDD